MQNSKLFAPLSSLQWVDRNSLKPNDYNPNKVSKENLKLLVQSILTNGWTLPIVVRKDFTIIDGFHRWTVAGQEPLYSALGGKVPVVIVEHTEQSDDIYGTVTHNRARGTHLLEPMKAIRYEAGRNIPYFGLLKRGFFEHNGKKYQSAQQGRVFYQHIAKIQNNFNIARW